MGWARTQAGPNCFKRGHRTLQHIITIATKGSLHHLLWFAGFLTKMCSNWYLSEFSLVLYEFSKLLNSSELFLQWRNAEANSQFPTSQERLNFIHSLEFMASRPLGQLYPFAVFMDCHTVAYSWTKSTQFLFCCSLAPALALPALSPGAALTWFLTLPGLLFIPPVAMKWSSDTSSDLAGARRCSSLWRHRNRCLAEGHQQLPGKTSSPPSICIALLKNIHSKREK